MVSSKKSKKKLDILVACHCKSLHEPVYIVKDILNKNAKAYNLYNASEMEEAKKVFGINRIDYIEGRKKCEGDDTQFEGWNSPNMPKYDVIFYVHCPFYGIFRGTSGWDFDSKFIDKHREFYDNIRKHLKPNGYLQIPFKLEDTDKQLEDPFNSSKLKSDDYDTKFNNSEHIKEVFTKILGKNKFQLDIITKENKKNIPFYVEVKSEVYQKSKFHRYVLLRFKGKRKTKKNKG